jgi:hypothetical protein
VVKIGARRYSDLLGAGATAGAICPPWLVDAARQRWGLELDGYTLADTVALRTPSPTGFACIGNRKQGHSWQLHRRRHWFGLGRLPGY